MLTDPQRRQIVEALLAAQSSKKQTTRPSALFPDMGSVFATWDDEKTTLTLQEGVAIVWLRAGRPKDHVTLVCPNLDVLTATVVRDP